MEPRKKNQIAQNERPETARPRKLAVTSTLIASDRTSFLFCVDQQRASCKYFSRAIQNNPYSETGKTLLSSSISSKLTAVVETFIG
jgi:hypothetical protein